MSILAYPGISWDKIARLAQTWISQDNNFRLSYPGMSLQRHSCHTTAMARVSFISTPGCLAAAGLVTPLRPCPDYHIVPFLGLRHGQAPNVSTAWPIFFSGSAHGPFFSQAPRNCRTNRQSTNPLKCCCPF